ncbi:MAG: lamin tail domain-containing protein, partial [Chloroflexi bacterium]|nr:lamin tail domain-containing protein [Chloroflexota bacterium]
MSIAVRLVVAALLIGLLAPVGPTTRVMAAVDHLVVSEVVTGGASASDELIELYNPTSSALPIEGLELVYATATGTTVSRRAAWDLGADPLGPGQHLLVAHELGIYAPIADVTYASGMAATGGSVALRIQGAATAIDAVGWGTAASSWLEGAPVAAPPAGSSVERLPGGDLGSTTDTDDNAADFVIRPVPDPRNRGSNPVPEPGSTAAPTPSPDPTAPPQPTASPTPTPTESILPIATARALPDDTTVTIEADALTSSTFTEGGGYVADGSGGIAVIVDGSAFQRGERVRLRGTLDTRYAQRTLRVTASGLTVVGVGGGTVARPELTGAVGEDDEAMLVVVQGRITGATTQLSGGAAWDVDDGSGPVRVLVGSQTGIDTTGWQRDVTVRVTGLVGQRDSSGSGVAGYRVLPRDADDVVLGDAPGPSPVPSGPANDPSHTPSPTPAPGVVSIAQARAAPKNARLTVRGVVTLPSGALNAESAVIQDGTGAILLRLGDEVGPLQLGRLVEVAGTRSTKSGMESLRVATTPRDLGSSVDPEPHVVRTGDATELLEARLVMVRGAVVATPRRASSGSVSFEVDDGSGPLRVHVGTGTGIDIGNDALLAGSWVEVVGVLGQETTGAQPLRGYRIWPRGASDLRVMAPAATDGTSSTAGDASADGGGGHAGVSLAALNRNDLAEVRVGATLVAGAWPELDLAGLLWDGERLVGIGPASSERLAPVAASRALPAALELTGLHRAGHRAAVGIDVVELGREPGQVAAGRGPIAAPLGAIPSRGGPAWVSLLGTLRSTDAGLVLTVRGRAVPVDRRCSDEDPEPPMSDSVVVTGIGLGGPPRIVVGWRGVSAGPPGGGGGAGGPGVGEGGAAGGVAAGAERAGEAPRGPAVGLVGGG